jgi:hypothetical protein
MGCDDRGASGVCSSQRGSNVEGRGRRDAATGTEPIDGVQSQAGGNARAFGDRRRHLHDLAYRTNSWGTVVTRNVSSEMGYCWPTITGQVCYKSPRDGRLEVAYRLDFDIIHDKHQCNYQFLPKLYVVTIFNIISDETIGGSPVHARVPMNSPPGVPPLRCAEPLQRAFERNPSRIGGERLLPGGEDDGK